MIFKIPKETLVDVKQKKISSNVFETPITKKKAKKK